MSLARQIESLTVADYLKSELDGDLRHEYVDGAIVAMAGASMNHNRITANLVRHLGNHLAGGDCEVFTSDLLLQTTQTRYRYPDVVVSCDSQAENGQFLVNAVLLIEVISRSTRKAGKEIKRLEYLQLPGLQEYVLIEQDLVEVEVLRRSQQWQPSYYYLGDEVWLESVGLSLAVGAVYERVVNGDLEFPLKKAE